MHSMKTNSTTEKASGSNISSVVIIGWCNWRLAQLTFLAATTINDSLAMNRGGNGAKGIKNVTICIQ